MIISAEYTDKRWTNRTSIKYFGSGLKQKNKEKHKKNRITNYNKSKSVQIEVSRKSPLIT